MIRAVREIEKHKEVGVDIECENNLHHYGSYISLIQLSTKNKDYLIDILRLKRVKPLLELFQNRNVEKVFHDVGFDLRMLNHQFGCSPKNIFDTHIAAVILGEKSVSLCSLLQKNLGVKKESKYQMADWTKRPLSKEMIRYAVRDTKHLIRLKDILKQKLKKKGRLEWAEEEFKEIERKKWEYSEGGWQDIRGVKQLTDLERGILKRLFNLRMKMGKLVDRPVHYILSTKRLIELAKNPPSNIGEWTHIRGVHPIVKSNAKTFFESVKQGRKNPAPLPVIERLSYTPEQKEKFRQLNEIRDKIAEIESLEKHIIMSKDQMRDIVIKGDYSILMKWQKELLKKYS